MTAQVKCITLSARDLAELLGISRSAAYALFHREDFPTLKIGRRLLVTHDALAPRGCRQEKRLNMQQRARSKTLPSAYLTHSIYPQLVQNLHTYAILFTYNRTVCAGKEYSFTYGTKK